MQTRHSNCRFSNQKARAGIGFSPRPLHESLADMTNWVMEHFIMKHGNKFKPCTYME
jgi:nucleoside-diphosphate-sugar epimerase